MFWIAVRSVSRGVSGVMAAAVSLIKVEAARSVVENASAASRRMSIRSCFIGILRAPWFLCWGVVNIQSAGVLCKGESGPPSAVEEVGWV